MRIKTQKIINIKLLLTVLLCCILYMGIMPLVSFAEDEYTYNEYTYVIDDIGNITITDVDESIAGDIILPQIIDGHTVTAIGNFAFEDCIDLTSVRLPDSVTFIGDFAFSCCSSLTKINIPNGVTSIGEMAFGSCAGLTAIELPDSLTSLGDGAFYNCDNLAELNIPASVTEIGAYLCGSCDNLQAIDVSDDNKYFSAHDGILFNKDKTELLSYPCGKADTSYTVPDGVTFLGDGAFDTATALEEVILPTTLKTIGHDTFYACSALKEIDIPYGVTDINYNAFFNCTSMERVYLTESVVNIDFWAFSGCKALTDVYYKCDEAMWDALLSNAMESGGNTALRDANIHFTHDELTLIPEIDSTCTEDGTNAHYICNHCGKWCEDEKGEIEVADKDSLTIPAKGHNLSFVRTKLATCTEEGCMSYYACTGCDKRFKDLDGKDEIIDMSTFIIPATGHTPKEAVRENETFATCDKDGSYDEVIYCSKCGEEVSREKHTVDAIGHDWGEWEETLKPTESENGEETRTCKNDPSHTETREIPKLGSDNPDDGNTTLIGDVNNNGKIDAGDATMVLRSAVGMIELTPEQVLAADVNKNGGVDAGDATMILRHSVGLITIEQNIK